MAALAAFLTPWQTAKSGATGTLSALVPVATTRDTIISAGANVQLIADLGTGRDTITGGTGTYLIVANALGRKGDRINVKGQPRFDGFKEQARTTTTALGTTTVFGTQGNDTLDVTSGRVVTDLLGGTNTVSVTGASDTLSITATTGTTNVIVAAGTKASILGGAGASVTKVTLSTGASTVNAGAGKLSVLGGAGKATVTLSTGGATVTAGSGQMSVFGGTGAFTFTHGKGGKDAVTVTKTAALDKFTGALGNTGTDVFNIAAKAGGKFDITSFSSTADKIAITGATKAQITAALKGAHTVKKNGSITTTLTIGTDKVTVVGGALTTKNFIN